MEMVKILRVKRSPHAPFIIWHVRPFQVMQKLWKSTVYAENERMSCNY